MSRIGNTPIVIPKEVTISSENDTVVVRGPKGEIRRKISGGVTISLTNDQAIIAIQKSDKATQALHGLVRARLANDILGVTRGWTKQLELVGVGYRASLSGQGLVLSVGFSHPVTVKPPAGITFTVVEGKIVVSGIDNQLVGQIAADIRSIRKPEPYKGKGIKYAGEQIRKKAGKAKAVGTTGGAK